MMFAKRLRQGIRDGRITCTIRIWQRPHVKVGGVYAMEEGRVVVSSVREIVLDDVTDALARELQLRRRRRPAKDREARHRRQCLSDTLSICGPGG